MSQPHRQRVVLSQRRGARMVRTRVEVQEQTEVGDALVRSLVRAQLLLSVRLAMMTLSILFAIPLLGMLLARFTDAPCSVSGSRGWCWGWRSIRCCSGSAGRTCAEPSATRPSSSAWSRTRRR